MKSNPAMEKHFQYDAKSPLTKDDLRRIMKEKRSAQNKEEIQEISKKICVKLKEGLLSLPDLKKMLVAVYLPSPKEIDILPFIHFLLENKIPVVSPRWNGKTYDLGRIKSLEDEDLQKGPMGIFEAKDENLVAPNEFTLWIVPCIAFTPSGKRIGYGGGWYDRLLCQAEPSSIKIGVACKFQVIENFQSEPHDITLNKVISF